MAEEPVAEDPVALAAPAAPPAAAPAADPKDGELVDISSAYGVPPNLRHNASIVTITRDGCLLTITVKIEVDGSYISTIRHSLRQGSPSAWRASPSLPQFPRTRGTGWGQRPHLLRRPAFLCGF